MANTNDGRIIDSAPYGRHIGLICKNHPNLRWSTKNIEYIGCRSIFYETRTVVECNCPISALIPIDAGPAVAP